MTNDAMLALGEAYSRERRRRIRTRQFAALLFIICVLSLTANVALLRSLAISSTPGGGTGNPAAAFSARAK